MTWFTTHLALEGMIAFIFIGYSLRKKFLTSNATKALFLLANTFAIIPDLDVYVGILFNNREHRGPSHSIFFPLTFVMIGFLILLYNRMKAKELNNPLSDIDSLFSNTNNTKSQILYLLPYVFFLAAFYWGFHLILDQDAGEGGMMMFWPLDNRLYQIQLFFKLNANPFFFLPWRPLGAFFDVSQSTIIGLYNYLFNWSPQDFIKYTGSTVFNYVFTGLILHSLIFMCWIYFVLRPCWPFEGKNLGAKLNFFGFFSNVKRYWQKLTKELLIPGIMLIIIGFSFGALVTSHVPDNQPINGNLAFTQNTFNAVIFVPLVSVSQPLDPNAQFSIHAHYQATNIHTGEELFFAVASESFFFTLQNQINVLASSINSTNKPANDTLFKQNYNAIITSKLTSESTIYLTTISSNQTAQQSYSIDVPSKDSYGVGFVLKNWSSKSTWNETNTQIAISGRLDVSYSRYVNYWIGMTIQIIGMALVSIALVLPFRNKVKTL